MFSLPVNTALKNNLPGLAATGSIAIFSFYLSTIHASFDPLVISIILAIIAGNLAGNREIFRSGLDTGLNWLLPAGIALYGMQFSLSKVSPGLVAAIFLMSCSLFLLTLFLSRIFRLKQTLSFLLASGLSICGASAIAVISPLIKARHEETSISILSVMMLGLVGMIFYPLLYGFFSLTYEEFNFLAGTTLPMIGQVKVAASNVCPECLGSALQIKLVRVAFLLFLVPLLALKAGGGNGNIRIPWFVVVFILMSLLVNIAPSLQKFQETGRTASTVFLAAGLAAVGFSVDLGEVIEEGMMPLLVILSSWSVVLIGTYLVRSIF